MAMSNDSNLSFIKQETACHVLSSLEIICFFHYESLIKEILSIALPHRHQKYSEMSQNLYVE